MAKGKWQSKTMAVTSLHLDAKNPRLGRETLHRAPRDIIQYLFDHDKALDVAKSIATRGYFPNEPLLVVQENNRYVVVEGNRRLAALKALREPGLLEGTTRSSVERLARQISDIDEFRQVPVTIAPTRRATDRQIAGRHIGAPVLAWQAENRASFILDKLEEGYTNDSLRDELGFTLADIQKARQTRAIADMARALELPEEVMAKIENPRAKLFTTIERVVDSSAGKSYLKIETDPEHGLVGKTTKKEFLRGFERLVTDVALGHQSSRSLNTNENIEDYFKSWKPAERPANKRGTFVPEDVISGTTTRRKATNKKASKKTSRTSQISKTVMPRAFKIRDHNDRLVDIRRELTKLKREDYPNAGAVLLRVFLELSVVHFLDKTGELEKLTTKLGGKRALPYGTPTMKQMAPTVVRLAKKHLSAGQANSAEKALRYDAAAPFSLSDLHAFVHQPNELPSPRDILQFWKRTEALFKLMLDETPDELLK